MYSKENLRNELPHETAVWPNDRPLRMDESKRSPQTHTAAAHEHGQQHCGTPADPSGAVKAYGFAILKEGSAKIADLVKVGGCLMESGFFRDRVKMQKYFVYVYQCVCVCVCECVCVCVCERA